MPRLWNETIEAHRAAVRDTTLDTAAALVAEHGLSSVTMSRIAEQTGIGRATLYKYFPDVESILVAWHERQVMSHLHQLAAVREKAGSAAEQLQAVLETYAFLSHHERGAEISAMLHQGEHIAHARAHLHGFVRDLLAQGVSEGLLRDDISPDEMASYCLHALNAAGELRSKAAVGRLVQLTLDGLRPVASATATS